ncbi:hypothetical protein [Burkholderia pyrrocinia]
MNIATVASVAFNMAVLAHPSVTEAPNWLAFGYEVPVSSPSEFNSSIAYSYIDVQGDLLQTDIKPAFEKAGMQVDRLTLVKEELASYSRLGEDWDGSGASIANKEHLNDALGFLNRLPGGIAIPTPMIGSSGDIGLYWDLPEFYADIAFEGRGAFSLFVKNKASGTESFDRFDNVQNLNQDRLFQMLGRKHNA